MSSRQAASRHAPLLRGRGFIVRHVVHLAAEGIEGGHAVALLAGQEDEGQRQVGGAFARDGLAGFMGSQGAAGGVASLPYRRQAAGFGQGGIARLMLALGGGERRQRRWRGGARSRRSGRGIGCGALAMVMPGW